MKYPILLALLLTSCGSSGGGGGYIAPTAPPSTEAPPTAFLYDGAYSSTTTTGSISFTVSSNSIDGTLSAAAVSTDGTERTSAKIYPSGALSAGYYTKSSRVKYPASGNSPGWTEDTSISIQVNADGSFSGTASGNRLIRMKAVGGQVMRVPVMGYFSESFSGRKVRGIQ